MLPFIPALLLLLMHGPSNIERALRACGFSNVPESWHRSVEEGPEEIIPQGFGQQHSSLPASSQTRRGWPSSNLDKTLLGVLGFVLLLAPPGIEHSPVEAMKLSASSPSTRTTEKLSAAKCESGWSRDGP
jgi:hypothetical protein